MTEPIRTPAEIIAEFTKHAAVTLNAKHARIVSEKHSKEHANHSKEHANGYHGCDEIWHHDEMFNKARWTVVK